jgi:hypothetical protein
MSSAKQPHDLAQGAAFALSDVAEGRLELARASTEGRSSLSLHDGEACVLRQTVTALVGGQRMVVEHPPDEGWILILGGSVTITTPGGHDIAAGVNDLIRLPREPLIVLADQDSIMLLTVAKGDRPR